MEQEPNQPFQPRHESKLKTFGSFLVSTVMAGATGGLVVNSVKEGTAANNPVGLIMGGAVFAGLTYASIKEYKSLFE